MVLQIIKVEKGFKNKLLKKKFNDKKKLRDYCKKENITSYMIYDKLQIEEVKKVDTTNNSLLGKRIEFKKY